MRAVWAVRGGAATCCTVSAGCELEWSSLRCQVYDASLATPCTHLLPAATMGAGGSKPEDIAKLAQDDGGYKPPLGPPNPVSCCQACRRSGCEASPNGVGSPVIKQNDLPHLPQENPIVWFDMRLGRYGDATPLGRIEIEVKQDICPKVGAQPRPASRPPWVWDVPGRDRGSPGRLEQNLPLCIQEANICIVCDIVSCLSAAASQPPVLAAHTSPPCPFFQPCRRRRTSSSSRRRHLARATRRPGGQPRLGCGLCQQPYQAAVGSGVLPLVRVVCRRWWQAEGGAPAHAGSPPPIPAGSTASSPRSCAREATSPPTTVCKGCLQGCLTCLHAAERAGAGACLYKLKVCAAPDSSPCRHRRLLHLRLPLCGRELPAAPPGAGRALHGQRGPQHQRLPVLPL